MALPPAVSCLYMLAPCIIDAINAPTAAAICDFLREIAEPVMTQGDLERANAEADGRISSDRSQQTSVIAPGCQVDIIAQLKSSTDALDRVVTIANAMDRTQQVAVNIYNNLADSVFSCAPLNDLALLIAGADSNIEECKELASFTDEAIVGLEAQIFDWKEYLNKIVQQAILADGYLQIFANLGICDNGADQQIVDL